MMRDHPLCVLEPDAIEPERRRPLRLAPPEAPAYAPCAQCGTPVLTGTTRHGLVVTVEPSRCCYAVLWKNHAPEAMVSPSRAYPVHECHTTIHTKETA